MRQKEHPIPIIEEKTVIINKDEEPVELYESVKGYFPIEQDTEEDAEKIAELEEEDDFKNITLKDGIIVPELEADKKLNDLQSRLQELKRAQAATKNKVDKYES